MRLAVARNATNVFATRTRTSRSTATKTNQYFILFVFRIGFRVKLNLGKSESISSTMHVILYHGSSFFHGCLQICLFSPAAIDVVMTDNEDDANPADANSADFQFRKLVKKGIMRRCACGNYIEKNGGCNYVKCPACGTGFCWTCHQLLGAGKPNCKHTSGHGPNPYQFVWDKPMLKPKADVGHSDNMYAISLFVFSSESFLKNIQNSFDSHHNFFSDDLTADGSQADLETRSRPSKCTISWREPLIGSLCFAPFSHASTKHLS